METTKNKLTSFEENFFNGLKYYIDKPIYFYGSIQRDDYLPQKSDIDIDIFSENEIGTVKLVSNYLNISPQDFKKILYRIHGSNRVVPGFKTKYEDTHNKLTVEISIYNEKYKKDILDEHKSKFNLPYYITFILMFLKTLHYDFNILPIYYYSLCKKYLTNQLYDNNKSEFIQLDL